MQSGGNVRPAPPGDCRKAVQVIRKAVINAVWMQFQAFIKNLPRRTMIGCLCRNRFAILEFTTLEFESANATIVKSIKQRDLLNTWLRLYAREQLLPRVAEYEPSRIEEELPDLVFFTVEKTQPPRLMIERIQNSRMPFLIWLWVFSIFMCFFF